MARVLIRLKDSAKRFESPRIYLAHLRVLLAIILTAILRVIRTANDNFAHGQR